MRSFGGKNFSFKPFKLLLLLLFLNSGLKGDGGGGGRSGPPDPPPGSATASSLKMYVLFSYLPEIQKVQGRHGFYYRDLVKQKLKL